MEEVPCIELEGGQTLYNSLTIVDYLDEAYPQNKLYPSQTLAKAQDKLLIDGFSKVITTMYKVIYWFSTHLYNMFMIKVFLSTDCT